MKRIIIAIIGLAVTLSLQAQELPLLSQRIFDAQYINPGVVGARSLLEITAHHRSQWLGYEGAPHTQVLSVNAPVGQRLGVGGFAVNDISGPSRNLGFGLTYGYQISIGKYNVGLGLTAGMMRYQFNGGALDMPDVGDPLWQGAMISSPWTPEFATGIFIYNKRRYIGLSFAQLVNLMPKADNQLDLSENQRAHFIAGYDVFNTKELVLTPSLFVTASLHSSYNVEVGVTATFYELIMGGVYYRLNDAISGMVGIKVKKNVALVYSYDRPYMGLGAFSLGSHEVVLQIAFDARQEEVCPVYRKILEKQRKNWKY